MTNQQQKQQTTEAPLNDTTNPPAVRNSVISVGTRRFMTHDIVKILHNMTSKSGRTAMTNQEINPTDR